MHEHIDPYRMDDTVASAACAAKGATTERSRAAVMGVAVHTMRRWRKGGTPPRLDVVDMVCTNLGVTREALFPHLMSAPDAEQERAKTQAELISEAADKIVSGWPTLTDDQRRELSIVMSAVTASQKAASGMAGAGLGRAA